jgi:hypothetical protein
VLRGSDNSGAKNKGKSVGNTMSHADVDNTGSKIAVNASMHLPFTSPTSLILADILEHHLLINEDSFLIEETDDAEVSSTSAITNSEHSMVRKAGKAKVAAVRAYIERTDEAQKCKLCVAQWGLQTATSTMDRHFAKYHKGAYREMNQQRFDKMNYVPYAPTGLESAKQERWGKCTRVVVFEKLAYQLAS